MRSLAPLLLATMVIASLGFYIVPCCACGLRCFADSGSCAPLPTLNVFTTYGHSGNRPTFQRRRKILKFSIIHGPITRFHSAFVRGVCDTPNILLT